MNAGHEKSMRVENEIDAALKMLGATQPPAAILTRVHHRLEIAVGSQRAKSGRGLLIPAAGVALAALALVVIFIQSHRTSEDRVPAVETAGLVANTSLAQATKMSAPATAATENAREQTAIRRSAVAQTGRERPRYRHIANLLSYPLTGQEKLLVRFAETAKPEDLKTLNPEYQAKVEAQQEAEFAAYLKSGSDSDAESTTQTKQSTQE
ncbi:MAG: hypothetical protein WBG23_18070 [Acidobacteriaceae bacterium]|jgi:hypothetical protein